MTHYFKVYITFNSNLILIKHIIFKPVLWFAGRKQTGEKAKWRNLEAKWRKNCCAIKIHKKLDIEISPNLMIKFALFSSFLT